MRSDVVPVKTGVSVSAGTRLHLGLVDMANATGRAFGGIGCILSAPSISVLAEIANETVVTSGLEDLRSWADLPGVIRDFVRENSLLPVRINIATTVPSHCGFGSGTATTMAALAATCLANGLPVHPRDLQVASRRGGTSGIGVHGFFRGGWIVDAGQRRPVPHLPSSAQAGRPPSLLLASLPPPSWEVAVFLPEGSGPSGQAEIELFREITVGKEETLQALATLYHGLVPALIEQDFEQFADALADFQALGFKASEIEHQSSVVRTLIMELRSLCPAVGMSSFGPLVFAFYPTDGLAKEWTHIAAELDCRLWLTRVSRTGWAHG